MGDIKVYRVINTVIIAVGVLACIASGFIPAPDGLLADGSISIIQALPQRQKLVFFALPALLLLASAVLVATGKFRMVALIAAFAGACIFASMDIAFVSGKQAFEGVLLNEAGIVMAVCGALLHAVGMPAENGKKASGKKKKAKKADKEDREAPEKAEHMPAAAPETDEAALYGNQKNFYSGDDNKASAGLAGRDTMELGDSLIAALNAITGSQEEPDGDKDIESSLAADTSAKAGTPAESVTTERRNWSSDSELEKILRNDFSQDADDPAGIVAPVTTEDIVAAVREEEREEAAEEAEEKEERVETSESADFYAELEEMFRIQE